MNGDPETTGLDLVKWLYEQGREIHDYQCDQEREWCSNMNAAALEIESLRRLVGRLTDKLADLDRDVPGIAHPDLSAAPFAGTASYHLLGRPQRVRMGEVEIVQVSTNDQTTATLDLPTPLVNVTPTGIFIEWHARGLDIEVRVRNGSTYVVIDDARGEVPHYSNNTRGSVQHAMAALAVMEGRRD